MFFFFYVLSFLWLTTAAGQSCGPGQTLFDSKCIQFFPVSVDFNTAESFCAALSGHLASIHSSNYNQYVVHQAQKYTNGSFWIGSGNGSNITYHSNQLTSQNATSCLKVHSETGIWVAEQCKNLTLPFACEFPPQTAPKCSPPVVPSHCPSGYTWFDGTDFCYRNYVKNLNFTDSRRLCQADGGDLASIHSQSENNFLVEFSKHGLNDTDEDWKKDTWIGFIYLNSVWQWTDGSPVNFINWGVGEPNVMATDWWTVLVPDEHARWNKATQWNNVGAYEERSFLCKLPALH